MRRPGQANFCFKKNCRQQNRQRLHRFLVWPLPVFFCHLFRKILFTELFYLLVNALAVEFVFCKKSDCRAGLSEDVLYTDFLHRNRAFLCQCVADCASKSSDDGVLFYGYDFTGLFCCCYDQLLIQRFDGVDVDDFCIDAVSGKFFCCFQSGAYAKSGCNDGQVLALTENNAFSELKFVVRSVYACASHGVLSGPAIERIENSSIKEMVFLDTVPPRPGVTCSKIKYLSVADIFAEAIERIYQEVSVSKLFN